MASLRDATRTLRASPRASGGSPHEELPNPLAQRKACGMASLRASPRASGVVYFRRAVLGAGDWGLESEFFPILKGLTKNKLSKIICTFVGDLGLAPRRWDVFLTGSP